MICGTVDYDVPATAQGRWFLIDTDANSLDESQHMALVPSNYDPDVGVLSVGNPIVGTDSYFFDFKTIGQLRRRFEDITNDGNIYCFDGLRNNVDPEFSSSLAGYLFFQLTTDTTLTIERVHSGTCPDSPNSLVFSSSAVSFER